MKSFFVAFFAIFFLGCNAQCPGSQVEIPIINLCLGTDPECTAAGGSCIPQGICCGAAPVVVTTTSTTTANSIITSSTTAGTGISVTASTGCIGPCFDNSCPTSYTCNLVTQECCSTTATTSSTTTCRDLLNPLTGVSDCPSRAFLCNNATYLTLMTQQCPRTCNRCSNSTSSSTVSSSCVDLVNPTTGVSDCPTLSYLCNNTIYTTLMTQQCPRTCGRCSSG